MIAGGGRLSHPYYWAAFVVTGNGGATVPVHPGINWVVWASGLVAALVLAFGALFWRRVR